MLLYKTHVREVLHIQEGTQPKMLDLINIYLNK